MIQACHSGLFRITRQFTAITLVSVLLEIVYIYNNYVKNTLSIATNIIPDAHFYSGGVLNLFFLVRLVVKSFLSSSNNTTRVKITQNVEAS